MTAPKHASVAVIYWFYLKNLLKIYGNEVYKFPQATNLQRFFKIVIFILPVIVALNFAKFEPFYTNTWN